MLYDSHNQFDAFISFSEQDASKASALIGRLQGDKFRLRIDDGPTRSREPLYRTMAEGIQQSQYILVCLSPAYLESKWSIFQNVVNRLLSFEQRRRRLVLVRLVPMDLPSNSEWPGKVSNVYQSEDEYQRLIAHLHSPITLQALLKQLDLEHDPFDYFEAEKMPAESLEETFIAQPGFEEMIDVDQSAVFVAPSGGGKTASRLRLEIYLKQRQSTALAMSEFQRDELVNAPLSVTYNDFSNVVEFVPNVGLQHHRVPLLAAIAESVYIFITEHADRFLGLVDNDRSWFWFYLRIYLKGESLIFRLQTDLRLKADYERLADESLPPFQADSTLGDVFAALPKRLADLSLTAMFILVDGIDGYTETRLPIGQTVLVSPLLDALSLLSLPSVVWKFFLPDTLKQEVQKSAGYSTGRLRIIPIEWDEYSLKGLLQTRLLWASGGKVDDINQWCERSLNDVNISAELVSMALRHRLLGPPRALLQLGSKLLESQTATILSRDDWNYFLQQVQSDLTQPELKPLEYDLPNLQRALDQLLGKIEDVRDYNARNRVYEAAEQLRVNIRRAEKVTESDMLIEERRRLMQQINDIAYRYMNQTLDDQIAA